MVSKICPICGSVLDENCRCPRCDAKRAKEAKERAKEGKEKRRRYKKPIHAMLLIALISMGILCYELYRSLQEVEAVNRQLAEYNTSYALLRNVVLDQMYDECGGTVLLKGNATGFFHVGKVDGIWWIVDPSGNAFISKGVNHVSYEGDYAPSLGYSPYNRVASQKYGSSDNWAKAAVQNLLTAHLRW